MQTDVNGVIRRIGSTPNPRSFAGHIRLSDDDFGKARGRNRRLSSTIPTENAVRNFYLAVFEPAELSGSDQDRALALKNGTLERPGLRSHAGARNDHINPPLEIGNCNRWERVSGRSSVLF
jgi:hypothetical protein